MTDQTLRKLSIITAIVGIVVSIYLTWSKITHRPVICGGYGGCETVNSSSYATIGNIPIALLGVGAYATILVLLLLENRSSFWREYSTMVVFGLALVGFLYSLFLTWVEIAVINAICPYCVVSAIAITLIFILAIIRLVRGQGDPKTT